MTFHMNNKFIIKNEHFIDTPVRLVSPPVLYMLVSLTYRLSNWMLFCADFYYGLRHIKSNKLIERDFPARKY